VYNKVQKWLKQNHYSKVKRKV